jgi:ATP-dependent DNA ligase
VLLALIHWTHCITNNWRLGVRVDYENESAAFFNLVSYLVVSSGSAIIDAEMVCLDANGVSQFNWLLDRKHEPVFYAFDLPWLDTHDLRNFPLTVRKKRLRDLIRSSECERIIFAQYIDTQGK